LTLPLSISLEARVAEIARKSGDTAALAVALERLNAIDVDGLGPIDRFELADALADDGQWGKAATLLDGLYAIDKPSELIRRRLFYLYRADDRVAARNMYQSLAPEARRSPNVLRLGAAIFEHSGMLAEALQVLETKQSRPLRSTYVHGSTGFVSPFATGKRSAQVPGSSAIPFHSAVRLRT